MRTLFDRIVPARRRVLRSILVLGTACLVAFWLGAWWHGSGPDSPAATAPPAGGAAVYYCSMDTHIRLPHPGKCSICGMDLIPLVETTADPGPRAIALSETAMGLADIATAPVERRRVEAAVRMVGKVEFDETRVRAITAWVPGRLERLYVDYTGILVRKDDHLVDIYSPKLYSAQQELLEARRAVEALAESESPYVRSATGDTLEAVREKLRLWGIGDEQIEAFEERGSPSARVLIRAPIGGIVVEKYKTEGAYVDTGTPIYAIADLSHLWVKLDAYESDLPWLRYGQDVTFRAEAHPGEVFHGRISFIGWTVDARTRTVQVRVNFDNTGRRLKPGMFVRAEVRSPLGGGGGVLSPELAGKWISPMHLEIVKDGPGTCDICGMDLVPAEALFALADEPSEPPLVIPASAPLLTGRRAVVYVKRPDREANVFEGREVALGPRAGGYYVVSSGLEEGEEVVARGSFKIDSALQIEAKPSMMQPEGGPPGGGAPHAHGAPRAAGPAAGSHAPAVEGPSELPASLLGALGGLRSSYFEIARALTADDEGAAKRAFTGLESELGAGAPGPAPSSGWEPWEEAAREARNAARLAREARDIEALRVAFRGLSRAVLALEAHAGGTRDEPLYEVFCPMAFGNQGASWLQQEAGVANPYFGRAMLRCGEVRRTFPPHGSEHEPRGGPNDD